jgi:hypothetical protein
MSVDSATISDYFDKISWTHRVVDPATVLTGYRCPVPCYEYVVPMEVKITRNWVYVRALLQPDVSTARKLTLLRLISEWNERCYRARFLLVKGCAVVQSEVPAVQCHFGSFSEALEAVCRYSTLAGIEIAILATNPLVSELYEHVEADRDASSESGMAGSLSSDLILDFDISVNTLPD